MAKRKKSDLRKINQFDTLSVHAGIKSDPLTGAVMTPIYATSTFAQDTPGKDKGYEYSRSQNPTREVLEASLAELENGHKAFAFASGVAAQTAVIDLLKPGDHVIAFDDFVWRARIPFPIGDAVGGRYRRVKRHDIVSATTDGDNLLLVLFLFVARLNVFSRLRDAEVCLVAQISMLDYGLRALHALQT